MKTIIRIYLILFCLLVFSPLYAQAREVKKTVLVISSYSSDSERTARFMEKFEKLIDEKKYSFTSTIAYMGFLGFESSHKWVSDMSKMLERYADDELAAVVLLGHEAWISYLEQPRIPDAPFYGCYMDEFGVPIPENMPDFLYWYPEKLDLCAMARMRGHTGGMMNRYDVEANIELIKKLYPETERIAFVTDNSYEGAALGTLMREVVVEKYPELNLASLRGLSFSISQIRVRIRHLVENTKNTVILIGTWRVDKSGRYYQESTIKEIFSEGFNLPVFTMTGVGLGDWAVGGYIPQQEWDIEHIVEDIHLYNMGETVESTFKFTESKYVFSREKMKEYGLREDQLPEGAEFVTKVNEEVQRYQKYLGITVVLTLIFLLMTAFIFKLLQKNKKVNRVLQLRNDELAVAKEQAEQSNKLKSAFLANMSHEIRTPLNAIVGFSELLKETDVAEEKEEYWSIIHTNNDLLLRLIGDILDLSKMEAGMIDLRPERFDVKLLFSEIFAAMEQRMRGRNNVKLLLDASYDTCLVTLDRNRMSQVVTNFVTNAIKFTTKGHIRMGFNMEENGLRVFVEDTGIGIEKEKLEKVFERFYKLNDFAQGTGLGMSICRAIMDSMGGTIGVESEVGVGSTFWACFPCKDIEICRENKAEPLMEDVGCDKGILHGKGLKVLIAEDNENHYLLLERMLKDCLLIAHARNGEEAIEIARKTEFDLILMNVDMPLMDGLEATRQIRTFDSNVCIVATSGRVFETNRKDAIAAGCNEFLPKPIQKESLESIIGQLATRNS